MTTAKNYTICLPEPSGYSTSLTKNRTINTTGWVSCQETPPKIPKKVSSKMCDTSIQSCKWFFLFEMTSWFIYPNVASAGLQIPYQPISWKWVGEISAAIIEVSPSHWFVFKKIFSHKIYKRHPFLGLQLVALENYWDKIYQNGDWQLRSSRENIYNYPDRGLTGPGGVFFILSVASWLKVC